jgi:hypothetical protein
MERLPARLPFPECSPLSPCETPPTLHPIATVATNGCGGSLLEEFPPQPRNARACSASFSCSAASARRFDTRARRDEFRGLAVAAVLMIVSGTVVYATIEHWSIVDAFYFAVSTLTTTSPTGLTLTHTVTKLFTTIYVLLGISIILEFARSIAVAYGDLGRAHREEKRADT